MEAVVNITYVNDLKTCLKCKKIFTGNDIIPLCTECRYIEAQYQV